MQLLALGVLSLLGCAPGDSAEVGSIAASNGVDDPAFSARLAVGALKYIRSRQVHAGDVYLLERFGAEQQGQPLSPATVDSVAQHGFRAASFERSRFRKGDAVLIVGDAKHVDLHSGRVSGTLILWDAHPTGAAYSVSFELYCPREAVCWVREYHEEVGGDVNHEPETEAPA